MRQARACNPRGTPRPQFSLARAARRSSASPTRKRRMVRFHPRARYAAAPRMGRSATNADGEGSSPSGGTTWVAVWDQPGLQNRAGGVRSLGNLRHASVAQRTERQKPISHSSPGSGPARDRYPTLNGKAAGSNPVRGSTHFSGRHDQGWSPATTWRDTRPSLHLARTRAAGGWLSVRIHNARPQRPLGSGD